MIEVRCSWCQELFKAKNRRFKYCGKKCREISLIEYNKAYQKTYQKKYWLDNKERLREYGKEYRKIT